MKLIKTIILLLIISVSHGCISKFNIKEYQKIVHQQNIDKLFTVLALKYKWLDIKLYNIVLGNLRLYKLERSEELKLINTIVALMDEESWHGKYFTGITCKVLLLRNGKYVYEYHRARGWMQVMIYNTTLKPHEYMKLYNPYINIYWGVNIFMKGYYKSGGNIQVTLKNYNSGMNSDHFNWKYINNIISNTKDVDELI